MKFKRNEKYEQIAVYSVISMIALISVYFFYQRFDVVRSAISFVFNILSPFVYGFIIAYLANPVMMFFENKVYVSRKKGNFPQKLRRPLSLTSAVLLILVLITLLFILMIPQIVSSYDDLQQQIGGYISAAQKLADDFVKNFPLFNGQYNDFAEFLNLNEFSKKLQELITNSYSYLSSAANYMMAYTGRFVVEVKNILLGIVLAVYFLFSKEKLIGQAKKISASLLSERKFINLISLVRYADRSFGRYIRGVLLDALLVGFLTFVVLGIFKFPFYPIIALVIGVTNMIPIFGPFIGAIPCALLIFIVDPIKTLWFVIFILVLQQIDGNIISPKILGSTTGLNALWVIVAITLGGSLFGILGMFLAVPTMSVIYSLVRESVAYRLKKRGMSENTADYADYPEKEKMPSDTILLRDEINKENE